MPHYASVLESNSLGATAVLLSGSPATVVSVHAINTTVAVAFIQLFDAATAASVTVGTTVPRWVVSSPATSASSDHGVPSGGIVFRNGIVAASTTTPLGNTGATQHLRLAIV